MSRKGNEYDWKDSNVALIGTDSDRTLKKESAIHEPIWQALLKCDHPELFIFRIKQFKVEAVPRDDYGKFFNGDSYIVVNVYKIEDRLEYDVHFWIGKNSTQDEYGTAAYKTVEVDSLLDDRAVQHREVEGFESPLFKSYFRDLRILEGGYESGFRHVKPEEYQPRLLHFCQKGNRVEIREVSFTRNALKSEDVFILDRGTTATQWNGKTCNPREKLSAAQFLQQLEGERFGRTRTNVIDEIDGSEDDAFRKSLPDAPVTENTFHGGSFQKQLYKLSDESGELKFTCISSNSAPRTQLSEEDVYFIMGSEQCFVYMGENCSPFEKKNALIHGINLLNSQANPCLPLTVVNKKNADGKGMIKLLD